MVKGVMDRLEELNVFSDIVNKGTTTYYNDAISLTFGSSSDNDIPQSVRKNEKVFRGIMELAKQMQTSEDGIDEQGSGIVAFESGEDDIQEETLFQMMPKAAAEIMEELASGGNDSEARYEDLQELKVLWTGWQIDDDDITYKKDKWKCKVTLGRGATSTVFAGSLTVDGGKKISVAVKSQPMSPEKIPNALREVFLHLMVQHHRIVTLYGMWFPHPEAGEALLVVDRMPRTLADALRKNDRSIDRVAILRDIAAALAHLHDKGIVHRDVKPENVLLNELGTEAKLSDFGCSRRRSDGTATTAPTHQAGTAFYMAPEVRRNEMCKTTPAMDCWAFGLLVCEVMNPAGRSEFVGMQDGNLHGAAKQWTVDIEHEDLGVAAEACVQEHARDRPMMKEVYLLLTRMGGIRERLISQVMKNRDWSSFRKVDTVWIARNVDIRVNNKREDAVQLCRVQADGSLQGLLRVGGGNTDKVTKTEEEEGVCFVLRDACKHMPLAAFVGRGWDRTVTVGANDVTISYLEANYDNKRGMLWPLGSAPACKDVPLNVKNKLWDVRVNRVDDSGREQPLIDRIAIKSDWTGHVASGSALVFRWREPGHSCDGAFVCAACVPAQSPGFTVDIRLLDKNLKDSI